MIGATMNMNGSLVMRSEKVGSSTVLSQIVQMVSQAQRSKAPMQRMADQVAGWFVMVVIGISILTFWVGNIRTGAELGLWANQCCRSFNYCLPMCFRISDAYVNHGGNRSCASNGVLFRDAAAIENLRKIDTLIIDKTGTLTEGQPTFDKIIPLSGYEDNEILRLAASLDQVNIL
ncbi:Silver exporting P-type ATPase [Acinetobacter baumannii]|nr:Silver exporting P-type ATPase [Acinetobacter baumannii]